jgi:hypothetical protein
MGHGLAWVGSYSIDVFVCAGQRDAPLSAKPCAGDELVQLQTQNSIYSRGMLCKDGTASTRREALGRAKRQTITGVAFDATRVGFGNRSDCVMVQLEDDILAVAEAKSLNVNQSSLTFLQRATAGPDEDILRRE